MRIHTNIKMADCSKTGKLSLSDCTCKICMYILIEPVTFPCGHELCMPCYKEHIDKASLHCPMCRTRIAVWARKTTRTGGLVDENRWREIQQHFPEQINNRLSGVEEESEDEFEKEYVIPPIAEPGELRKEYEEERQRLDAERAEQERLEEEASGRLISELQQHERKRREQELKDEQLAAALSKQLNGVTPVKSDLQEDEKLAMKLCKELNGYTPSLTPVKAPPVRSKSTSTVSRPSTSSPQQQSHLKMWYRSQPKEENASQSTSDFSSRVLKTTQLTPNGDCATRDPSHAFEVSRKRHPSNTETVRDWLVDQSPKTPTEARSPPRKRLCRPEQRSSPEL